VRQKTVKNVYLPSIIGGLSMNRNKKAKTRSDFERIQPDLPKIWHFINRL